MKTIYVVVSMFAYSIASAMQGEYISYFGLGFTGLIGLAVWYISKEIIDEIK